MEEPQQGGGVQSLNDRHTTGKLPLQPEENANGAARKLLSPEGEPGTLQFTVIEGLQVGRGVARIDPQDMAFLNCTAGDTVLITGTRTTAAKAVPLGVAERGQRVIQMDSQVRQNC